MKKESGRVVRERKTVEEMVKLYCHQHHDTQGEKLCDRCSVLLNYAFQHIEKCKFHPEKPTCRNCTVHCYSKKNKNTIKDVMRFSGQRMMLRFPALTILHLIDGWKDKKRQEEYFKAEELKNK